MENIKSLAIRRFKNLGKALVPQDALSRKKLLDYLIRSKNLFERDTSIQDLFKKVDNPEYYKFLDTEGILYFRELYEASTEFPPWIEMLTVGGETDVRKFLKIGYECYQAVKESFPISEKDQTILDFGVGCGRTMRFFQRDIEKFSCYGVDVDRKAINYLSKAAPFIKSYISKNDPPLPFSNGKFDIVYSISVFTHLNISSFNKWVEEMRRVIRKGGTLIVSLHGSTAFNQVISNPTQRKMIGIQDSEFDSKAKLYKQDRFIWVSQPTTSSDIDTNKYGINFIEETEVPKLFLPSFELISYQKGKLGGWQDIAVFQRC